jgi:hypothetical protein
MNGYRVRRWVGFDGPAVAPVPQAPILFEKVRAVVGQHVQFAEEWMLDIVSLWVLMAYITHALPSVFYLLLPGTKGKAKTVTLDLLSALTGALNASDVSVAALVHWLDEHRYAAVAIDEMDVRRGAERDSALAAVCRNGYTPGKPYLRWDATTHKLEKCPTFGAKAIGYRDKLDSALEDRGFVITAGSVPGREGASLVLRNLRQKVGDLPLRLKKWSETPGLREAVEAEMASDNWIEKVEAVVGAESIGASRETQLTMIALAACRAACIDLTSSLQAAFGLRREVAAANTDETIEEALEVLEAVATSVGTLTKETETYVVRQKEFVDALNARRTAKGLRPLNSTQIARLRNDMGIRPTCLTHPKNKATWNIPAKELEALLGRGVANPPNLPNPTVKDDGVSQVSQVRQPAPPLGSNGARTPVMEVFKGAFPNSLKWERIRPDLAKRTGFSDPELDAALGGLCGSGAIVRHGEGLRWRGEGLP